MRHTFVDPRVRMRNALRVLVQADPERWHEPSLTVFRNRLLDETGSDARPLAELLLEALQRGWRERMPRGRVEPARWDALSAPFVMQWSAERFVQPDMAQWATESWGLAFDVIAPEQLRIARPKPPAAPRTESGAPVSTAPGAIAAPSRPGRQTARQPSRRIASVAGTPYRPPTASTSRRRYVPSTFAGMSQPSPRVVWSFAGAAVFMYLFFIAQMFITVRENKRLEAAAARVDAGASAAPSVAGTNAAPSPATRTNTAPSAATAANTAPSAAAGMNTARSAAAGPNTAPSVAEVTPAPAAIIPPVTSPQTATPLNSRNPGVPSVTRNLLDANVADPQRMLYVEPARRAQGNSRPVPTAASPASLAFDEVILANGGVMRGRVEIVRAGTVIFRDMRTGLRHEIRKDSIDRIITEYGAPVRFRVAGSASGAGSAASAAAGRRPGDDGPRARGVAGAYLIRYEAAVAVGSPECTNVWRRAPNATDRAIVRHVAGADTLRVDFVGGDTFLSNMDGDGYFASTFRIVPDQARTSTALTTRLTGQFRSDGSLTLQVSIVFYRRMREGRDLACTVTVNATGSRS